ncbi:D-alanyl-D-alanine carboxypeptidase [Streptomyces adustus]|uniref:D-alanyl-D-alanine carboxypeptidase n=1 Tax=Streptomyces adustus TaxID=1609272 RepID=UPI0030842651
MAGESPDRSKQRESSAEPTSGSAGAVPEARGAVRDPRLAVARESSPRGGVDTATRVFSVRKSAADAEETDAAEPADEVTEDTTAEDTTAEVTEDTAAEGDAAEKGADDDAAADGASSGADDAADDTTNDDADDTDGDLDEDADGDEDAKTAGTAADAADDESADRAAEEADESGSEAAGEAEDASAGDEPAPKDDARLRAAVAAWVGSADRTAGTGPDAAAADEDAEGADEGAESPEDAPRDAAEDSADVEDAEDAEDSDADAAAEEATQDADGDDAEADATDGESEGRTPDAEPETEPETGADADADAGPEDGDGSGPAAERFVDQPTAVFKAMRPTRPAVDQPTTMLKLGDATKRPEPGTAPEKPAAKAPEKPAAKTPEKAPEKAAEKPAVDQPTTMLKLGGATKRPEPGTAPEKPAAKAPEKPAAKTPEKAPEKAAEKPAAKAPAADPERTSRFVALKPLDDTDTRGPRPADVTSVVPQVGPERTTQQPLPPKPPLDLLAELTNTPPPPETALRTTFRRVKIWTPLVVLLVIVFAIVQAVRPLPAAALTLTAEDSYSFDGDKVDLPWPSEGQGWMDVNGIGSMDDFGRQTPVAIGSVAKAMTAYVVLKDHPMKPGEEGASIPVDATAEKEGGYDKDGESTLNTVKEGDKLSQKQALSAVMIPSANNIARLLARWDAGSEAAFIKKMNDTAKQLGMTNTTYTDASGLKETTVSTAQDQVKLGHELVKIQALMDITKLPSWTDPSGQKHRNYNTLVPYNNALGIKTGSTTKAGGNLLFAATKEVGGETVTLVGAVLGQHKAPIIDTVNAVSKTALLAAQDAMTSAKILKKGDVVGYVDDRLGNHTPVVVTKDVSAVGWAGLKVKLTFDSGDVPHSAKAGTEVGSLTVGDGSGDSVGVQVPVALQTDLAEPGFMDKVTRLG